MSHDYHESLPGYSPEQIWVDGCEECERRGRHIDIAALDTDTFSRAVVRARQRDRHGITDMSEAERPLLDVLAAVAEQVERADGFALLEVDEVSTSELLWLCDQASRDPEDLAAADRIVAIRKRVAS